MTNKACTKCGESKPLTEFNVCRSNKKDSRRNDCIMCERSYQAMYRSTHKEESHAYDVKRWIDHREEQHNKNVRYYADNRDKMLADNKQWRDANPDYSVQRYADHKDESKAYNAQYHIDNRELLNAKSAQRRIDDPATYRASVKNWQNAHPDKGRSYCNKRRVAKLHAQPVWADQEAIDLVYEVCEQRNRMTGIKHCVDHFYPLQGKTVCGLHVSLNLVVITAKENHSKYNKMPEEFYSDD